MSADGTTPDPDATPGPDVPHYGLSVSYTPCSECQGGSLVYDPEAGTSRCEVCGVRA